MEALHFDFFQSVFSLPACRLLDAYNICCENLAWYDDDYDKSCDHDDDDCDESNVDSRGKVRPSQMWGHFCCAVHPPQSHDDDDDEHDYDKNYDDYDVADDFYGNFDIFCVDLEIESCEW